MERIDCKDMRFHNGTKSEPLVAGMPNYTLKNIPETLFEKMRDAAARNHRSINGEILESLKWALANPRPSVEQWLEQLKAMRESLGIRITMDEIDAAKNEGRR